MKESKLRFKGYEFNYNPHTLSISHMRNVASFSSPLCPLVVQDLGIKSTIVSGEGVLVGENCIKQYESIAALMETDATGRLQIPNFKPMMAVFSALSITAKPIRNALFYKFEFVMI